MSAGKLPEWPVPFDDPNWNAVHRLPYWESRCRLAVEALETIERSDLEDHVMTSKMLRDYARDTLTELGPLPSEGK